MNNSKITPQTYTGGGGTTSEIYAMTDGISHEQFEEIIEDARAEGNLSRSNVTRKAREAKGRERAAARGRRKPLSDTLLNCLIQLQGTVERLALELEGGLDDSVTADLAGEWADDLTQVIRPLTRLRSQLKEKASG